LAKYKPQRTFQKRGPSKKKKGGRAAWKRHGKEKKGAHPQDARVEKEERIGSSAPKEKDGTPLTNPGKSVLRGREEKGPGVESRKKTVGGRGPKKARTIKTKRGKKGTAPPLRKGRIMPLNLAGKRGGHPRRSWDGPSAITFPKKGGRVRFRKKKKWGGTGTPTPKKERQEKREERKKSHGRSWSRSPHPYETSPYLQKGCAGMPGWKLCSCRATKSSKDCARGEKKKGEEGLVEGVCLREVDAVEGGEGEQRKPCARLWGKRGLGKAAQVPSLKERRTPVTKKERRGCLMLRE